MILLGQTLGFWTGLIAGIFILLHIPSCNVHWANKLKPLSTYLSKHHNITLNLATLFAVMHILIDIKGFLVGFGFNFHMENN